MGSSGNLTRHMRRKHPTISIVIERQVRQPTVIHSEPMNREQTRTDCTAPAPSTSAQDDSLPSISAHFNNVAPPITDYFIQKKPLSARKSAELDRQLVKMISKEYQPFRLVEDVEFIKFVEMLNPNYSLPTRKTLSNSLLDKKYYEVQSSVKEDMSKAQEVCITTDGWTSMNNDSFIAITAHFIDNNTILKNYLLDCVQYSDTHTATNLTSFLKSVFQEWNIENEIVAIVSDNAANILAAVRSGNWPSIGCFAHKINLVLQDALGTKSSERPIPNTIGETISKVKNIVQYLKKSAQAKAKYFEIAKNMGIPRLKLIQDTPTRWQHFGNVR